MTFCTVDHVYYLSVWHASMISTRKIRISCQIEITEDHRDLLRFLCFKNINDVPLTPTTLRFTTVVYGLTSSPFLLNGTIKHHLEKYMLNPNFMEIIKKLIMNLQVDHSTNIFDNLQISSIIYKFLR